MSAVVEHIRRRAITASGFTAINPRPPSRTSPSYDLNLATIASKILFRSGLDANGGPLFILCAAAFPDTRVIDYNKLLPYVLSELPREEELAQGLGYSVVFFAGGTSEMQGTPGARAGTPGKGGNTDADNSSTGKWNRPAWSWSLQAYNLLSRAVRKGIKRLYIVHERSWVRILFEMAQTVVSPKFKKKVVHVNNLSDLATMLTFQNLNIPPQVYLHDRKTNPILTIPNPPPPMFGVNPFPPGEMEPKLPLVLIETSRYLKQYHLKTEGIFRIPPSIQLLDIAKEAYDRGQFIRPSDYGPHVAAGLIKLYYRSLPEPLIPTRFYAELEAKWKNAEDVRLLLTGHEGKGGLPFTTRVLLTRHLIPLMAVVSAHAAANKMTVDNLSICIAASLVRGDDPLKDMMLSRGPLAGILAWGIEHVEELTPVVPVRHTRATS
ncbi:Rho GTPase activation protein, partial [Peziza echinospora]